MPDGGELALATANVKLDRDYCSLNPGVNPGDYVAVSVMDTGRGIPADVLPFVFEPFVSSKEETKAREWVCPRCMDSVSVQMVIFGSSPASILAQPLAFTCLRPPSELRRRILCSAVMPIWTSFSPIMRQRWQLMTSEVSPQRRMSKKNSGGRQTKKTGS